MALRRHARAYRAASPPARDGPRAKRELCTCAARILLVCWVTWDGEIVWGWIPACSPGLPHPPRGSRGREVTTVTITDIGILLIVLCISLWAIMAALHRHTVQLEALKSQMQELLKAREMDPNASAADVDPPASSDRMEASSTHVPAKSAAVIAARQSVLK